MFKEEPPVVDLFGQPREVVRDKVGTEFVDRFSSRAELQSLVSAESRNLNNFAKTEAMLQRIEDIITKSFNVTFNTASTGGKNVFYFNEIAISQMIHHELMDKVM